MIKKSIISIFILITVFLAKESFSQKAYSHTNVEIAPTAQKMILTEISRIPGNGYKGYPSSSKLYNLPLNCDSAIELINCDNYHWSKNNKLFAGYKAKTDYESEIFLYDLNGCLIDTIENGYVYSFVNFQYGAFYRQNEDKKRVCQIMKYDHDTKVESIIYTFGENYTFYHPEDHDGFGYPSLLDSKWGGICGVIYKITQTDGIGLSGNIEKYETYTFVISPWDKKIKYWLRGNQTQKERIPKDEIVNNGL